MENLIKQILSYFNFNKKDYDEAIGKDYDDYKSFVDSNKIKLYYVKEQELLEGNQVILFFGNKNIRIKYNIIYSSIMKIFSTYRFPQNSSHMSDNYEDIVLNFEQEIKDIDKYIEDVKIFGDINSCFDEILSCYINGYETEDITIGEIKF